MPGSPSRSDVHVNRPLTNISEAYLQEAKNFVHASVFPTVSGEKRSDLYFTFNKGDFNRDDFKLRAPGAESAMANFGLSTSSYTCGVWSLGVDLDDQTLANADSPLNLESDSTKFLMNKLAISMEKQWVSSFFGTSKWTGSSTGSDITSWTWSAASQDPVADIQVEMDASQKNTGYMPNTIVFGAVAFRSFINNSAVLDRIKYTQQGTVTEDLVGSLLGLPRVFVLRGVENTAAEGQTATMANIGDDDDVFICYTPAAPSLMTPSAGYQFSWNRYLAGSAGQRVHRYDRPENRSTRVEVEAAYDYKLIAAQLGSYSVDVDAS